MPELAAIFAIGLIAELVLTAVYAFLTARRQTRGRAAVLSSNLAKAGVYWSEHTEKIRTGTSEDELRDRKHSLRTIVVTGSLLALLSWLGAFFLLILMLSHRHLARSRLERALFASRLAREPQLSAEEVRGLLTPFVTSIPSSQAPNDRPPEFAD